MHTLGTINGLAQLSASAMRTIGPAAASALFSRSVERGWAPDGYGVYAVWITLCVGACGVAGFLPRVTWDRTLENRKGEEDQEDE